MRKDKRMTIYRASLRSPEGHQGYRYGTNRKTLTAYARRWARRMGGITKGCEYEVDEILWHLPQEKADLVVRVLNRFGTHNDNG